MKHKILFFLFLSVLACGPKVDGDPKVAKLQDRVNIDWKSPEIEITKFSNGLTLYFLPNNDLPVVEVEAFIKVGTDVDPQEKLGLTRLFMSALATGGSKQFSSNKIDEILESIGADVSSDADNEYCTVSLSTLSRDIDETFEIFFDILKYPAFEAQKVAIIREGMIDEIGGRNEKPISIANREFMQKLYGEKSVQARVFNEENVRAITIDDLKQFHQNYFTPNNIIIAVAGDISLDELKSKINSLAADWQPHEIVAPQIASVVKEWEPSVNLIKTESNQSGIVVGHFAEKRFNPDKYALILANHILGGLTFGSRLGDRIRTTLGLAYSVSSNYGLESDYGAFRIFVSTKSASTVQVVQEIRQILSDFVTTKPPTKSELEVAKRTILNQLVFQYEDPFKIVTTRVIYDFYGYPPDYLSVFQKAIMAVTAGDVKTKLQKYIFPDKLQIMIVGNPAGIGDMSVLGKVNELPLDNH